MSNFKKVLVFQKSKRRNRTRMYFILLLGLFSCFFVYTVIVLGHGTIVAMNGFREQNLEGEDIDDEVARLLGGPDEDPKLKPLARDLVSVERTLSRLLRVKRSVVEEDREVKEANDDEDYIRIKLYRERPITSKPSNKECARRNGLFFLKIKDGEIKWRTLGIHVETTSEK